MFQKTKYPDGQVSAEFKGWDTDSEVDPYLIKERINSYEDLFYVRAMADAVEDPHIYTLYIPCLFGQRSDRRFADNKSFDLKLIAEIINNCNFKKVIILDPHSDVSLALIKNSYKETSSRFVRAAVDNVKLRADNQNPLLVAPDAGAYKKVFEYGQMFECPVVGAMKYRGKDGTIDLMFTHDVEGQECLIVDDLCDGGATFINLGKKLKDLKASHVYLYVTHGLFSKGFKDLAKVIDHVYCTNSVQDLDVREIGREEGISGFITQYKMI